MFYFDIALASSFNISDYCTHNILFVVEYQVQIIKHRPKQVRCQRFDKYFQQNCKCGKTCKSLET